ncbi:class I SAM-dependent methyltransferase [Ahrensia marina]|uniref:class I SAM-dependent methyltransferase n=1 Tax=Ahrensia marina TaxID=1514904 RepID=UPI0035D0AF37
MTSDNEHAHITGSTTAFDTNWRSREESYYNHWVRGRPANQIQLAFRSHWEVFQGLMGEAAERKGQALEVGCGRGSLSSYFADAGWECTLLDYSATALTIASEIFQRNGLLGTFTTGDANALPFPDNSFDATTSIGLLEHFEDVRQPIAEQLRVLKPGGWFIAYIVPERPDNVQRYFNWANRGLKLLASSHTESQPPKDDVYRSDLGSERYLKAIKGLPFENVNTFGMYPMPMISHSPEFPFTLLPPPAEWILTRIFQAALASRRLLTGQHGWICSERLGQAFLLAFQKSAR